MSWTLVLNFAYVTGEPPSLQAGGGRQSNLYYHRYGVFTLPDTETDTDTDKIVWRC